MVDSEDDGFQDYAAENSMKGRRGDDDSLNEDTEKEAKVEAHSMKNRLSSEDSSTKDSVEEADKEVKDKSTSSPGNDNLSSEKRDKKVKDDVTSQEDTALKLARGKVEATLIRAKKKAGERQKKKTRRNRPMD